LFPEKDACAESGSKIDKLNTFFTRLLHSLSPSKHLFFAMPDESLTVYAARVEAAIASYLEIRDFADAKVWKAMFEEEKVSYSFQRLHGVLI
jgi:hypothetical protein